MTSFPDDTVTRLKGDSALRLMARAPWFIPTVAAIIVFVLLVALRPAVASFTGLSLVITPLLPLIFAVLAQMFIIAGGDIDLGIGSYIGLVNVIFAVVIPTNPVLGIILLPLMVLAYAGMGALIYLRKLPSIVVTLGMSFVWLGIGIVLLPTPGGQVPQWIVSMVRFNPGVIPMGIVVIVVTTVIVAWFLERSKFGAVLRGVGSNPEGIRRAGWSVLRSKLSLYALAGLFGVISGLYLSGQGGGGDANIAQSYVLLSIAGVIVGGGSFAGGKVSVVGAVAGALVVGLIGSLLQFLGVPSSYQAAAQGLVLVFVLVLRAISSWIRRDRGAL
ncbi:MAG: ABC transporter permease [Leucobacter sp.]